MIDIKDITWSAAEALEAYKVELIIDTNNHTDNKIQLFKA